MTIITELVNKIEKIGTTSYISKRDRQYVIDNINLIKKQLTSAEDKQIQLFKNAIENAKVTKDIKVMIESYKPKIVKIVKKYQEEYNDESNEDVVDGDLSTDEVEKMLDSKVDSYNKFNDKHPMKGITFDESNNKYQIKYDNIHTYSKDLGIACNKIMDKIYVKNPEKKLKKYIKMKFAYANHHFISYWHNNQPFFDIQHIISLLNLKTSYIKEKYNEFSDNIDHYLFHQNKYNGYILRELINETTMYQLVLSSNSIFSKKFKIDIAKILTDLRKQGQLSLNNNEMTLTNNQLSLKNDNNINKPVYPIYSMDNEHHVKFINDLISIGSKIALSNYVNCHTLYACFIPLKTDHRYFIIKFGYTYHLAKRMTTLESEYGSKIYLVRAKVATSMQDEENFHDILKLQYSELIQKHKINNKNKVELYKFTPQLLFEFENYLCPKKIDDHFNICLDMEMESNQLASLTHSDKMIDYLIKKMDFEMTKLKYQNHDKIVQINESKTKYLNTKIKYLEMSNQKTSTN